jgi:preprotein translocase subunit SecF
MFKKINKKTYIVIVVIIFFLLILPFFSFKSFQLSRDFNQNSVAGKVVVVSESFVEIEDVRKEIKRINFNSNLEISKGRTPATFSDLATGTFIVAELDPQEKEFPTALKLRILDPRGPRFDK